MYNKMNAARSANKFTVNYMGGRTTPMVSIVFYFKNHKKLWEWILLHQSVDIGLEKLYAISFG